MGDTVLSSGGSFFVHSKKMFIFLVSVRQLVELSQRYNCLISAFHVTQHVFGCHNAHCFYAFCVAKHIVYMPIMSSSTLFSCFSCHTSCCLCAFCATQQVVYMHFVSPSTLFLCLSCHTTHCLYAFHVTQHVVCMLFMSPSTLFICLSCHPARCLCAFHVTQHVVYTLQGTEALWRPRRNVPVLILNNLAVEAQGAILRLRCLISLSLHHNVTVLIAA